MINGFGEIVDTRTPVDKSKLDEMKLECFNNILEHSHMYYERYDTYDGAEYDFHSESFGEWVEGQLVGFHSLKEEELELNCAIRKREITTASGSIYKLGEHLHITCYTETEKKLHSALKRGW